MSNPFLVDLDENYTPYTSGISTPFSGAATPTTKRRNSTNPFEILSPDGDEQPVTFLDHDALQSAANEINNNNNNNNGQHNVASAIADMTADFYQAITKHDFNFDATINDDVFEQEQHNRLGGEGEDNLEEEAHDDEVEEGLEEDNENEEDNNNISSKPVTTVKTVQSYHDEDETLFDPFETIHDDDGMSSKRSSVEVANLGSTMMSSNKTVTELASSLVSANSAKAKELFNSSMASFELLAAGGKSEANPNSNSSAAQNDLLLSPMTPSTPPSNYDDNSAEIGGSGGFGGSSGVAAFLSPAPTGMDIYSSDLSDMSDVSPTTAATAAATDVRSAFNMYSGESS